ncbi:glycosyltransferase family 2 protein [Acinetobacter bouvetii]|uniref:O-antigen biosynthesis glycosyltransferase WbnJ n=1 Tax=Acinetobacter bouvetii TaxID=202951 RepID=A0A811GE50_9GAMM|nr:glycosyltransferase [Acinetobacter bouvetii]CAB1220469.1 O-antigen biosynthesis glycosyltransferase WbnJ [Acinetobacter bouvetii]
MLTSSNIDLDRRNKNESSILDISVVAANYNNAPFLEDFFEAWKNSSTLPMELIFIDDGSKDNSLEIAYKYEKEIPTLIILPLGQNQGFGNALNAGIKKASCKYILRIDPDDIVLPERLVKQYEILESGKADVVGSDAIIFQSKTGKDIGLTNFPQDHETISKVVHRGEHGVLHPTVMAKTELFKNNPYIQANVPAEDYDIFARMLNSGAKFYNIKEPLLRYRIHQRSASNVLPFSTIEKTYRIRDEIFSTKTNKAFVIWYFLHIKCYRKYLFSDNKFKGLFYLGLASFLRPDKVLKKLLSL